MKRLLFSTVFILTIAISSFAQSTKVLSVGDKAPAFKTLADNGSTWDVNNYIGKKAKLEKLCNLVSIKGKHRVLYNNVQYT